MYVSSPEPQACVALCLPDSPTSTSHGLSTCPSHVCLTVFPSPPTSQVSGQKARGHSRLSLLPQHPPHSPCHKGLMVLPSEKEMLRGAVPEVPHPSARMDREVTGAPGAVQHASQPQNTSQLHLLLSTCTVSSSHISNTSLVLLLPLPPANQLSKLQPENHQVQMGPCSRPFRRSLLLLE